MLHEFPLRQDTVEIVAACTVRKSGQHDFLARGDGF